MATAHPTTADTRREKLRLWINQNFGGSQVRFLEDCASRGFEINQGEFSGLLKKKSFGEKKARSLESMAGMPHLYLDTPVGSAIQAQEPLPPLLFPKPQYDEWTSAAIAIMSSLDKTQKAQMVAKMREYRQFLGPPRDGQALQVAG